jgi:hypothetical protein
MALSGQVKRTVGPVALTSTLSTNVYNNTSALLYDVLKWIHVVNKTGSSHNFTLFIGATGANAAGTEWFNAQVVAANSSFDLPLGNLKLLSTDFIVGGADANTALTLIITGEQVVV